MPNTDRRPANFRVTYIPTGVYVDVFALDGKQARERAVVELGDPEDDELEVRALPLTTAELVTIRSFAHGAHRYRHAMDYVTDTILLQRYNQAAETPEDEWTTMLEYTSDCRVRRFNHSIGMETIANFTMEGGRWVLYEGPLRTRVEFKPNRTAEALLDAEVEYSQRWLAAVSSDPQGSATCLGTAPAPSEPAPQ